MDVLRAGRIALSLALAAFASACSQAATSPALPLPAAVQSPERLALEPSSDPCRQIQGTWIFEGPCEARNVPSSGATFALRRYRGIDVTLKLPSSTASGARFVVADGTSDANITGTWEGKRFPVYRSIPCKQTSTQKRVPCYGEPLVYVFFFNESNRSVTFGKDGFRFVIASNHYPGATCQIAGLDNAKTWDEYQVYGRVKNGVSIYRYAPVTGPQVFGPLVFEIFAFTCR